MQENGTQTEEAMLLWTVPLVKLIFRNLNTGT
jgi:hypothetical protein